VGAGVLDNLQEGLTLLQKVGHIFFLRDRLRDSKGEGDGGTSVQRIGYSKSLDPSITVMAEV